MCTKDGLISFWKAIGGGDKLLPLVISALLLIAAITGYFAPIVSHKPDSEAEQLSEAFIKDETGISVDFSEQLKKELAVEKNSQAATIESEQKH